jgi:hypothetical protein
MAAEAWADGRSAADGRALGGRVARSARSAGRAFGALGGRVARQHARRHDRTRLAASVTWTAVP